MAEGSIFGWELDEMRQVVAVHIRGEIRTTAETGIVLLEGKSVTMFCDGEQAMYAMTEEAGGPMFHFTGGGES